MAWDWKTKCRLTLGVCANQDKLDKPLAFNLMEMIKPERYALIPQGQHIKSGSLNKLVAKALELESTHILFMDADMEFPIDTIPKLLEHQLPIVSGLYHLKVYPFSPICGWNRANVTAHSDSFLPDRVNGRGMIWKYEYYPLPNHRLVEVHWTGVGCLMVDMDVFRKIYYPPFWDDWDRKTGSRLRGHDLVFCDAVREEGYKVYVDTQVDCGHREQVTIDRLYIESFYESGMDSVMAKRLAELKEPYRDSLKEYKLRFDQSADVRAMYDNTRSYRMKSEYWNSKWRQSEVEAKQPNRAYVIPLIQQMVPAGETIGEWGCGVGNIASFLISKGYNVYGYDYSPEAIRILKSRGMEGEVADISDYQPEHDVYHTILASHLLEHLSDEQEQRAVEVMRDMAQEQVIVVVPKELDKTKPWVEHTRVYDADSLMELLKPHFEEVSVMELERLDQARWAGEDLVALCIRPVRSDEVKLVATG